MEPFKTHGATLPQQGLTQPAGGCPFGPRPADSELGGHEGANPHVGTRVASEAVDYATADTSQPPGVSANRQGGCTRLHLYECFSEESKKRRKNGSPEDLTYSELANIVIRELGPNLKALSSNDLNRLIDKISFFLTNTMKMFRACKSNKHLFKKRHKTYLEKSFLNDLPEDLICHIHEPHESDTSVIEEPNTTGLSISVEPEPSPGLSPEPGPSGSFQSRSVGYRQQLRSKKRMEEFMQNEPPAKLIKGFVSAISSPPENKTTPRSKKDLETIIQLCLESPTRASEVYKKISSEPQPYTAEEALGVMIDRKFSVETYKDRQQDLKSRGYPVYPPYSQVLLARKACYPTEEISLSDVEASVSLKGLLTHTLKRIVQSSEESFTEFCDRKKITELNCVFEGSWGFDGSTGQSFYKQRFDQSGQDPLVNENSLFATTFVPLRIQADDSYAIWVNPTPQSYRFCRPLHIQYRKETSNLILNEKAWGEDQIRDLTPITIETTKGHTITFICNLTLSVIDGKVLNIITGTSSQLRCPFCKLTSSNFNNLEMCFSKATIKENMKYGINPLHAWIRIFEFLLHLGYKNDPAVQKWRINQNTPESRIVDERKRRIQGEIRSKMGLLVDIVRPNAGTTNDGNTARTALSDKYRNMFGDILGLETWLLDDLYNILVTINCELPIDSTKFGTFCRAVAEKYVAKYSWHPMTVTIHKILVHGQEIIDSNTLPVGMLSEQAAESRNKFWRRDREQHCRKMDRKKTMLDLFHRALESSDPAISMLRLHRRQKFSRSLPLPAAVRNLLKAVDHDETGLHAQEDEHAVELEFSQEDDNTDDENLIILSNEANLNE